MRPDRQAGIVPTTISHGAISDRTDRFRFQRLFGWVGTADPTPYLAVPAAIEIVGSLLPGGWAAVLAHNHRLALLARDELCRVLDVPAPVPDALLGSMAAIQLPDDPDAPAESGMSALQQALFADHGIEVPTVAWPAPPNRLVALSAQLYNSSSEYVDLGHAIRAAVDAGS